MKTGRSLQDVLVELTRQENAKRDFIASAQRFRMVPDGNTFELVGNSATEQFGTSDLFHRQVASILNIPQKYYDMMRTQKPKLLAENVNTWFGDKTNSYMIRSLDYGEGRIARAMLSERYRRIDNLEVASAVLPLFAGQDGYEVMSCEVTENKLYLKIVNHRLEAEVVPGDIVQAGVLISNSEVGLGSVSVQPLVYRLVCTNGMVVNSLGERKNHVGRAVKGLDENFAIYADDTLKADDEAFLLKLRDVTLSAIEESRFGVVVDKLRESVNVPITGRIPDVVELTGKTYNLNQTEQDGILRHLIQGGDLSQYGLSQAVTRTSQDIESYDRATALESIGWQIVTMEPRAWSVLNSSHR